MEVLLRYTMMVPGNKKHLADTPADSSGDPGPGNEVALFWLPGDEDGEVSLS